MSVYLMLFALVVFYGCAKPAAEVNGEKISMKTYKTVLNEKVKQHSTPETSVEEDKLKDSVVQQLIGEMLLLQAAKENNVTLTDSEFNDRYNSILERFGKDNFFEQLKVKDISIEEYKSRLRDRLIIEQYILSLIPADSIEEKDIKDYYKNSSKPIIFAEKVMVRMIQVQTAENAEEMINEMKEKKLSFDEMADILNKEKRVVVSEYGWIEPAFFSEEISSALKSLKKGTYGGPYKAREGYYLLRVKDRKKEKPKTYDEAKEEIRITLLNQKRQGMLAHLIEERKKKATIKIYVN
jgi:parvulin-like peptidyl-prolyl isomerase